MFYHGGNRKGLFFAKIFDSNTLLLELIFKELKGCNHTVVDHWDNNYLIHAVVLDMS